MKTKTNFILILLLALLVVTTANYHNILKIINLNLQILKRFSTSISRKMATISKPSTVTNNKRKDFSINRKQKTGNHSQRRNTNIQLTELFLKQRIQKIYFRIDKSGNSLWDGKHWIWMLIRLKFMCGNLLHSIITLITRIMFTMLLKLWQKSDSRIQYTFTNNSRDADIKFVFVENLGKKYEENYLGLTDYDVNGKNEIEQSTVQISLIKFGDEKVSAGEIKATIIHELGHVFGLVTPNMKKILCILTLVQIIHLKKNYDELSIGDKQAIIDAIDLGNDDKYVRK